MILSDRTIREELAAGRIVIDPLDEGAVQPSSVDLRLDRLFRVFLNHTTPVIDVKRDLEDLTRLVEIQPDDAFILHPGEFVLGSTYERISLPDDIVARIEGKSSLGRLGLLIHSSLPGSEPVLVFDGEQLRPRPIEEIVRKGLRGMVAAFDPETFEVGYHEITGWYEGPPDRIYEVVLASGRTIRVTAGHNLFTLDRAGNLTKVRTQQLQPGARVAVPGTIPDPVTAAPAQIAVADLVPESDNAYVTVAGPTVVAAFEASDTDLDELLKDEGYEGASCYRSKGRLPYAVAAQVPGLIESLGTSDIVSWHGGRNPLPAVIDVDSEVAWLLGMYVAEGDRRANQVVISNTDEHLLERLQATLRRLGLTFHRGPTEVTCGSIILSSLLDWLGTGGKAPSKRVPPIVFGWPRPLVESFLEGVVDGDGSVAGGRTSVWTSSSGLVSDLLLLFARLGRRAGSIEQRRGRDAVRRRTLDRLRETFREASPDASSLTRLGRLVDGGVLWDEVVEVRDTGVVETIFDLEVRPGGRKIENFVAGHGGVFASNTAGFVDAGFSGHITLELSNVANLPITLYPGMKIGQVSFLRMTTPADAPYGSSTTGSKYQGQRGPTPSRYWENFNPRPPP